MDRNPMKKLLLKFRKEECNGETDFDGWLDRSAALIRRLVDTVRRAGFITRLSNAPTAKRENNAKAPRLYRRGDTEADNGLHSY